MPCLALRSHIQRNTTVLVLTIPKEQSHYVALVGVQSLSGS